MYECLLSERSLSRLLVSCRMTLSTFSSFYGKRPQGSYAGACERRRRRLLSSWVNVSMIRKSRILPNKTRINYWLVTVRFCMASKQQRKAIKTYRGGILLCDQSLTGNDLKGKALSRNLGNYFDWLAFVVRYYENKKFIATKFSNFFANTKPNVSVWCEQDLTNVILGD